MHFCAIISEEHSSQFSWKPNNSTYPINVEVTWVISNLKFLASKEIKSFLASFLKVCVKVVMLPTSEINTTWNPLASLLTKNSFETCGKGHFVKQDHELNIIQKLSSKLVKMNNLTSISLVRALFHFLRPLF